jgi:predicted RNA-binding protein YlqC (UPF0109 family)
MKELLEYVLKQIVNHPEDISVEEISDEEDPTFIKLMIEANTEDKGLIIGKNGSNISAFRDLIGIKAVQENKKVRLEISD